MDTFVKKPDLIQVENLEKMILWCSEDDHRLLAHGWPTKNILQLYTHNNRTVEIESVGF